jgi:hypothetical protein
MIKFKLNGKPLKIPSSWDDPTFGQYIKIIQTNASATDVISIFTGIDIKTLKKAKIEGLEMIMQSLSFLKKSPQWEGVCDKIGKYVLPINSKGKFDIQFESLGQFEDMRSIMNKVPEDNALELTKSFAQYVAIYLQKIRDGEYDQDKAGIMLDEVYAMPAKEVITVGSFFFLKLLSLSRGIDLNSLSTNQKPKKQKPVSKNSRKHSEVTRQSRKRR